MGTKESAEVLESFSILIWVVVIEMYTSVKISWPAHFTYYTVFYTLIFRYFLKGLGFLLLDNVIGIRSTLPYETTKIYKFWFLQIYPPKSKCNK